MRHCKWFSQGIFQFLIKPPPPECICTNANAKEPSVLGLFYFPLFGQKKNNRERHLLYVRVVCHAFRVNESARILQCVFIMRDLLPPV